MEKYSELSEEIKEEVYQNKKETTEFMNAVKTLFFVSLITKETNFNKKIDKIYKAYINKTNKQMNKGYKKVVDKVKSNKNNKIYYEDKSELKKGLNEFLEKIKIDSKSTKTENDKYIRIIKDYYKKTEKTLSKEYIQEKEYLSKKVSSFDKIEKTVRYQRKDGSTFAYFDIASYDSMVYTTNLNRVGMQETIKELEFRGEDIVYVAPHPFACPLCQQLQGKFYSITGSVSFYKGYRVGLLDDAIANGLLHPNCTHIPRPILDDDEESDKYSSGQWEEKYNAKQKRNGLELKKDRLKSDLKIYKKLDNQEMIDKTKQKINTLNKEIREQKKLMVNTQ